MPVVVCDESEALVGIVSERDIARAAHAHGSSALDQPVSQIMTALVVTCDREANSAELMGLMTEKRVRHIPCGGDDQLVGIVSIGDIVKARLAELETERDAFAGPTSPTEPNGAAGHQNQSSAAGGSGRTARCTPAPATGGLATRSPRTRSTRRCASRRRTGSVRRAG